MRVPHSRWPPREAPRAGRAGELGELSPGAVGDVAIWSLSGPRLPEPWPTRWRRGCGAVRWRRGDTIVGGRAVVRDGRLVSERVDEMLALHHRIATAMQAP